MYWSLRSGDRPNISGRPQAVVGDSEYDPVNVRAISWLEPSWAANGETLATPAIEHSEPLELTVADISSDVTADDVAPVAQAKAEREARAELMAQVREAKAEKQRAWAREYMRPAAAVQGNYSTGLIISYNILSPQWPFRTGMP
jgi:hypothetical protein